MSDSSHYIYNITFAAEASRLDSLLGWIRSRAVPALNVAPASNPRLAMVEAPDAEDTDVKSVALQLEFHSLADFEAWEGEAFLPLMKEYSVAFAPEPLLFASMLRILEL